MGVPMMNWLRKPNGDDIRRQQLEEAKRMQAIYSAEQEKMAAMAEMYTNRIQRIESELNHKGEA